ncbi:MAG: DUF4010 domain-containing protein [Desulfurococcales archaeon]|nr:DUF4010 domain-containing protein [Desulfurococcales archaeon]
MVEGVSSVFIVRMITGLLGGILIGLERERAHIARRRERQGSIPGMRTFGLISLYGALSSYIASETLEGHQALFLTVSVVPILSFILLYAYTRMMRQRVTGITTYVVMLNTFLVGALAGLGLILESASISVLVTLILAMKTPAERIAASLNYRELIAILEVAALFLIIGPIVSIASPMLGFIDLMKAYLFFTMVLALSLTSYIAARIWGARGLVYTAILGSIVNSEAMISAITRSIASTSSPARILRTLVLIVIGVMQARASILVLAALYIFGGPGAIHSIPLLLPVFTVSLLIVYTSYRVGVEGDVEVSIASPLSWGTAFKSAIAYIILTIASTLLARTGVSETILVLGAVGGLVNATATILGIASVLPSIGFCTALGGMLVSIATATLNKPLYADYNMLDEEGRRVIWSLSMVLSLVPLAASLLTRIASC